MYARLAALAGLLALCAQPGVRAQLSPPAIPTARSEDTAGPLQRDLGGFGDRDVPSGPWKARKRSGVRVVGPNAAELAAPGALNPRRLRALGLRGDPRAFIDVARWPREPDAPKLVTRARFARALARLCPPDVPAAQLQRVASATLAAGAEFGVDPFLLAALTRHQSGCRSGSVDSWGVGLTRVNLGMHRARVDGAGYRFGRPRAGGGFERISLPLGTHPFTLDALLAPEANLHYAAAFLKSFAEQCPAIDRAFRSAPHRHPVSHVIWGDHVRSALPEAQILTERRRLLDYYARRPARQHGWLRELRATLPLDGAPRIVTGLLGDPREHGKRKHAGIDLPAAMGEPVRAVADGVVSFAGVDTRQQGAITLAPEQLASVPDARMGPRGVFVRIAHGGELSSLYVHLGDYVVHEGQRVTRGEIIGNVGLSGVHTSDAHLHLGLFDGDVALDPMRYFGTHVLTEAAPRLDLERLRRRLAHASRRP